MKKNLNFILLTTLVATTITRVTLTQQCGNVQLESPNYSVDTQFRALIFKPSASNLHYAAQAQPLPLYTPDWNIFDISPKYHFGFDLGVRVLPHNQCISISVNWEHFKASSHNAHQVPNNTDMVGPFFEIGPDAAPYRSVIGNVQFKLDTVHLTVGQFVQAGANLQAHFFAGINFTSLHENLTTAFSGTSGTSTPGPINRTIETPSKFIGAGPEFGLDMAYKLVGGFNITGRSVVAILAGSAKNHTTYSSLSPVQTILGFPSPNIQNTTVNKRSQIVPELQQRLGLAYQYPFNEHYMIKIEAGYEARVYFNAIQSVDIGSEVIDLGSRPAEVGVFARTFQRNISNFALSGAYVALNVAF